MDTPVGYNITHDNGVVAMVYSMGADLYPDPPTYRVGVDVMLLQLPKRDTFPGFVEIFSDQVSPKSCSLCALTNVSLSSLRWSAAFSFLLRQHPHLIKTKPFAGSFLFGR